MQKGRFVELVIIRLGGGVLADDMAIQRVDVEALLPAAASYAIAAGRNNHLAQEGDRDFPSMFFGTFSDLPIDRSGKVPFIILPKGYVPLYGGEGLRSIYDNCGNYYSPLMEGDRKTIKYYQSKMEDQGFYFPLANKKVEVYTTNPLVATMNGEYIVDIDELDDTDELPLAGETAMMALDVCVQWISDQRERQADLKNTKVDEANIIK